MKRTHLISLVCLVIVILTAAVVSAVIFLSPADDGSADTAVEPVESGLVLEFIVDPLDFDDEVGLRLTTCASNIQAFIRGTIARYTGPPDQRPQALDSGVTIKPLNGSGVAAAQPGSGTVFISQDSIKQYLYTQFYLNNVTHSFEFVVILHETLHLLHLTALSPLSETLIHPDSSDRQRKRYVGSNAVKAINSSLKQCNEDQTTVVSYIALEDDGDAGTEFVHIDENNEWHTEIPGCRVLANDITSGFLNTNSTFTTFTLGLIQDHRFEVFPVSKIPVSYGINAGQQLMCQNYSSAECDTASQ